MISEGSIPLGDQMLGGQATHGSILNGHRWKWDLVGNGGDIDHRFSEPDATVIGIAGVHHRDDPVNHIGVIGDVKLGRERSDAKPRIFATELGRTQDDLAIKLRIQNTVYQYIAMHLSHINISNPILHPIPAMSQTQINIDVKMSGPQFKSGYFVFIISILIELGRFLGGVENVIATVVSKNGSKCLRIFIGDRNGRHGCGFRSLGRIGDGRRHCL